MKTKLTQCLVMGALAIGMSSTVMAVQPPVKIEKLCDLSTLKGLYHFSQADLTRASAGEFRFDGQGGGVGNMTLKFPEADKRIDQVLIGVIFHYEQDIRGECVFSIPDFSGIPLFQTIYAEVSGDAASVIAKGPNGRPAAFELTRGPISSTHE